MLIERTSQLAAIERVLEAAAGSAGGALLVDAPAGMGKTSLLRVAGRAAGPGVRVLRARGAAPEQAYAHGLVRQLLGAEAARAAPLRGAATMAAGALGLESPAAEAGRVDAFAVQHGLTWLCAQLAEEHPLLLLVDDAQWGDAPSLRWLAHLARRLGEMPVALLVAWRTGTPAAAVALRDELAAAGEVVAPGPLTEAGVAQLVREVAGVTPGPAFVAACREHAGGNPFYVSELVRAILAGGASPDDEAVALLGRPVPAVVAEEVSRRLGALGDDGRALADAIAVLDADAELRHAAHVAGLDVRTALAATDELTAALLLEPGDVPRFRHPLLRQVVYEQIPTGARALCHRRAADVLDPDRAVGHLLRCPPAEDQRVAAMLLEAARRAIGRGAVESARTLLDRALREPAVDRRAEVLLELGRAGRLLGEKGAVADLREAQQLATSVEIQEAALLEQALVVGLDDRPAEALGLLDRAIALHPAEDEEAILRLLAMRAAYALTHDDLAREAGDLGTHVAMLGERGVASAGEARLLAVAAAQCAVETRRTAPEAATWARRAMASGSLGASAADDLLYGWAARALLWADEGPAARPLVAMAGERAAARGWRDGQAVAAAWAALLSAWEGRLVDARVDAHAALETGTAGAFGRDFALAVAVFVELDSVGAEDASALLAGAGEPAATSTGLLLRWARCSVALARGGLDEAVADARAIEEAIARRGAPTLGPRATAVAAMALAGHREGAIRLAHSELDDASRWGAAGHIGVALRELALAAGGGEERARLEQSVGHLERSPRRVELARSLLALGSHLRRTGERRAARERLRTALDLAVTTGARPLADAATEELRASGARLRRERLSGVESLTPSEHRIARLAAGGLSNPEIAQRLYLSRATVESHLTRAYRKLDVAGRDGLGAVLGAGRSDRERRAVGEPT